MLTVRFPNGQAIQYNTAHFLSYKERAWELYEKEGGRWVASIQCSSGAIVESVAACRVYQAQESELSISIANQIEVLGRKLRRAYREEARQTSTNRPQARIKTSRRAA